MIGGTIFGGIAVSGLLGTLVTETLRKRFYGNIDADFIQDELEFDSILSDNCTVSFKDDTCFRVYEVRGISYDNTSLDEEDSAKEARGVLFNEIHKLKGAIRFFAIKRNQDISFEAEWPSETLKIIGDQEAKLFKDNYVLRWFMVVSASKINRLVQIEKKINSLMSLYKPRLLRRNIEDKCELTNFIYYLVSGEFTDHLIGYSSNVNSILPGADITHDKSGLFQIQTPKHYYYKTIAIERWDGIVSGMIIADIMSYPADIEICQICLPIDKKSDMTGLSLKTKEIGNSTSIHEHHAVKEIIADENHSRFETQFQIVVRSSSIKDLDEAIETILKKLGQKKIMASLQTVGSIYGWFNRLPDHNRLYRPLKLLERNVAALWSFYFTPEGQYSCRWGNHPARLFKTPTGGGYPFNFQSSGHKDASSNAIIIGGAGAGKSTILMHILGGLAKNDDFYSFIFDSNYGAQFMIEVMGGNYLSYDQLALNPLDVGELNLNSEQQVFLMLKSLIGDVDDWSKFDSEIRHAIDVIFKFDAPERTLSNIFDPAFVPGSALRAKLQKWVVDRKGSKGIYSHIFNAGRDSLGGDLSQSFMTGINMNEALADPVLGPPVVLHITNTIKNIIADKAKGFFIFIDEAGNLLQNQGFFDKTKEMYREVRKQGGGVCVGFQDPQALFDCPEPDALLDNTSTLIFFPNSQVKVDVLKKFNLSEEHIDFILKGSFLEQGSRKVLVVKRDGARSFEETAIINVDLTPFGDALSYYQAGGRANRLMKELKERHGDAWAKFISH